MSDSAKGMAIVPRTVIEAVVIVGSILLAFAIDAAWDGRQEREARVELITAIRDDLAGTRASLAEALPAAQQSLTRSGGYMEAMVEEAPISIDSLRFLYDATFDGLGFQPTLSSYDGAISAGRLFTITTPELRAALTRFDGARSWWEDHLRTLYDAHYTGPTWELRRQIGTDAVIRDPDGAPPAFRLGDSDLRAMLTSPEAFAVAEVHDIIFRNIHGALSAMDEAAAEAIALLELELAG